LSPATPAANSFMFALPIITTPASLSFRTASASVVATRVLRSCDPIVVRIPAVSKLSL